MLNSATKQIGLLRIRVDEEGQHVLQLTPIMLKTVRQFYLETVSLNAHFEKIGKRNATVLDVEEFCSEKIEEMIRRAEEEHSGDPRQPKEPLIRLRVDYTDEYLTLSANHFGQRFVGRVANPKELILFKCKKFANPKTVMDANLDIIDEIYENEEQSKHCNIDDVINEYFENVDPVSKLTLLGEKRLTEAVKSIVEKDAPSTKITALIDWHINSIKEHITKKNDVNRILDDHFLVREIMHDFKEKLRAKEDAEDPADFEEFEKQYAKKSKAKTSKAEPKAPAASKAKGGAGRKKKVVSDSESEEEMVIEEVDSDADSRETSSRSASRASVSKASTTKASAPAKTSTQRSQFAIIQDSSSDDQTEEEEEEVTPAKKATRGRGRGRGASTRGTTRGRGRGKNADKGQSDYFKVSK